MASRADGDVWNIVDNDSDSQHYGRTFKFDFSYISSEEISILCKRSNKCLFYNTFIHTIQSATKNN